MSTGAFLPAGYQAPTSGGYAKIEAGDNRYRILSNPLFLWVLWSDGKPKRIPYLDANGNLVPKPATPTGQNASVKHAWALIVWNYDKEEIQILELDKATLLTPLSAHASDPAWGHPQNYDVIFNKTGSGQQGTKYSFRASPPAPIAANIADEFVQTPIDLNQLLVEGGDPFLQPAAPVAAAPAAPAVAPPPAAAPPAPAAPQAVAAPAAGAPRPF